MSLQEIIKSPGTRFVDVRTAVEFNMDHIEGAINLPLDQVPHRYEEISGLGETPVVFYCRSGARSGSAVAYLSRKGIKNIYDGGGLDDLQYYLN